MARIVTVAIKVHTPHKTECIDKSQIGSLTPDEWADIEIEAKEIAEEAKRLKHKFGG